MDNITYDENGERVLQGCPRKCKQIGKTDHHSGNCICHKGNTFNRTFDLTADRASGCHKRRPIGEQRPCKSRDHRHHKRVGVYAEQGIVLKHCTDMLCVVGKRNPVLPVHRKGLPQHHDHWQRQKEGKKDCQQDKNHFNLSVLSHRSLLFSRPASVPASARKTEYRYYFSLSPADSG